MSIAWILLSCILWLLQQCVTGDSMGMCNSPTQCGIKFSMNDTSNDSSSCSLDKSDIVQCNKIPPAPKMGSGVKENPSPIEIKLYCLNGEMQCYIYEKIKEESHLLNTRYCCKKTGNYSCEPEITCKVECGINVDCIAEDDEDSGSHVSLPGAIGGTLGTVIVIIIISMVAFQLIQMHQKRELENHQRGAGKRDDQSPYIHSLPQPRYELPAPQYAGLEPPVYAELEANHIENFYSSQHVYEEADKYLKCPTYDNSKAADDKEFTISPPCDDDYAEPNDVIVSGRSENQEHITNSIDAVEEKETTAAVPEQTKATEAQKTVPFIPDPKLHSQLKEQQ